MIKLILLLATLLTVVVARRQSDQCSCKLIDHRTLINGPYGEIE